MVGNFYIFYSMVGDFGWEHEGTKSGVGTVKVIQESSFKKIAE